MWASCVGGWVLAGPSSAVAHAHTHFQQQASHCCKLTARHLLTDVSNFFCRLPWRSA